MVAKIAHNSPASRSRSGVASNRSSWASRSFSRHILDSRASRSVSLILCKKSALLPASSASVRLLDTESAARTSCRQTVSLGMLVNRRGHATLMPVLKVSARRCKASVLARAGLGIVMPHSEQTQCRSTLRANCVGGPKRVALISSPENRERIKTSNSQTVQLHFEL